MKSEELKHSTENRVLSSVLKEKTGPYGETRWGILRWMVGLIISFVMINSAYSQEDIDLSSPADTSFNHPSKRTAILLSLALPGLGEAYGGNWARARTFFITEGIIWTSFTALRVFCSLRWPKPSLPHRWRRPCSAQRRLRGTPWRASFRARDHLSHRRILGCIAGWWPVATMFRLRC